MTGVSSISNGDISIETEYQNQSEISARSHGVILLLKFKPVPSSPLCVVVSHRGTVQAQRIQATSSASWWRREFSAARRVGCDTVSEWTTASSCRLPSRPPPIEVKTWLFVCLSVIQHSWLDVTHEHFFLRLMICLKQRRGCQCCQQQS